MSQTSVSHGWFTQLQKQYPMSALVTELVQIHQERFIVKAIVQLNGVAIATSMADSTTLEMAEDQARLRVLDFLGIFTTPTSANLAPLVAPDLTTPISSDRSPETPLPEILPTSIRHPIDNGFPIKALPNLDPEAIEVSTSELIEMAAPPPLPAVPMPEISVDLSMPFSTSLFSEPAMPTEEDHTDETVNDHPIEEYLPSVEDYGAGYEDSEPEYELSEDPLPEDPLIETETVATIAPAARVQEDQREEEHPVSANLSKPKKAIAEENPIASLPSDANEPDDLSTLIAHTDVEMDRIGWTKQEGRDYLKRTYKKSTRQRLDVDELMDFLNYLRALPSVNGI
ncbi:hypothetical protein JOY44_19265 [Phormidium sp. CLA17]|uniref:hypothetical protein n=1 Tax=Leptolyngbya sp. Cla-17 TaxID=2803751 RepID=UPI00149216A5|nr:hypothetical protein [Leptolyngbya sp. Cla-17]MBM0743730.1 hypothetical protein [Leptolyngbya sp. Cla-17]